MGGGKAPKDPYFYFALADSGRFRFQTQGFTIRGDAMTIVKKRGYPTLVSPFFGETG
jgi:hypothetical protein